MATGSGGKYRVWIRPFRRWWKPLAWIWGVLILGVIVNDGSSWLISKSFDVSGTPLGWVIGHLDIMLPCVGVLTLLTCLAGLAYHQAKTSTIQTKPSLVLTLQQRLQFIRSFRQEYSNRLTHSLQGRAALELGLHERTDMIASSAGLVFHHADTTTEYPLPSGTSIIQIYDQAQRGLLILGAPGSGKSTLLLHLAVELLQRAESDLEHPIPIILNLSSWAEKKLPLADWFCEQCLLVYGIPKRVSVSWITSDQVLLLLDGLDEVEASVRSNCLDAINRYRGEHLVSLVVCSRSRDYENQQVRLILPVAVEIQQLEVAQVTAYLKRAGKSLTAIRAVLRSNMTFQQLLTTPLMLTTVILTYRDKTVRDLPQMGSPEEQQRQIFTQYVQRMLERHRSRRIFSFTQTSRSLVWLAGQMWQRHLTEFYLELLQSDWLETKHARKIYGLILRLLGWQSFERRNYQLVEAITWSWRRSGVGLGLGLISGVIFMLLCGLSSELIGELSAGLSLGLSIVLLITLSIGLLAGISSVPTNPSLSLRPNQGIHTTGWNALRVCVVGMLALGLFGGLVGQIGGLYFGLVLGSAGGLIFGGYVYLRHYLLRLFLAQSHVLPWRAVPLLEEVTACILLQRVGGGYRFIHPLLQEYFASLATAP